MLSEQIHGLPPVFFFSWVEYFFHVFWKLTTICSAVPLETGRGSVEQRSLGPQKDNKEEYVKGFLEKILQVGEKFSTYTSW